MTNTQPLGHTDSDVELAIDVKTPEMFAIIMHNDDYTTQEFVVEVLMTVLAHPLERAVSLMLQVHFEGRAKVAVYPLEIAKMKQQIIHELAESADFPLLTSIEPE